MAIKDSDFLDILKTAEITPYDEYPTTNFIDTGSYALNALASGSIYGGIPDNKGTMFAGAPSAGKSFLTKECARTFLNENDTNIVLLFDTESEIDKSMLERRGFDMSRFLVFDAETLQDFRTKAVKFLDAYMEKKKKPKVMMILDSLSNLPTQKEVADAISGSEARDMTKAQVIRSIFRVLTSKMGRANVPLLITSHVYSSMDQYSPVVISGGCLVQNSKIQMSDGSIKNIQDIQVGDIVKTLQGSNIVTNTFEFEKNTIKIQFDDDFEIECSEDHRFLVENDSGELMWKCARDLVGDENIVQI